MNIVNVLKELLLELESKPFRACTRATPTVTVEAKCKEVQRAIFAVSAETKIDMVDFAEMVEYVFERAMENRTTGTRQLVHASTLLQLLLDEILS